MKPEAGQWWVDSEAVPGDSADDVAVRIAIVLPDKKLYVETSRGVYDVWTHVNENVWHHEPRCTGWDWVVPEPEPQPAEDPDEWVIQDRVPPRAHVDVVFWSHWKQGEEVVAQCTWEHPQVHGFTDCFGHQLSVRCRRRDLPKVEQAEQWPKYYKPSQSRKTGYGKHVAYYKCSETEKGETVHTDGTSFGFTVRAPGLDWTEIAEAEAMLLLNKPTEPEPQSQPQKTRVSDEAVELITHLRDQMDALSKRVSDCEKQLMMTKAFWVNL